VLNNKPRALAVKKRSRGNGSQSRTPGGLGVNGSIEKLTEAIGSDIEGRARKPPHQDINIRGIKSGNMGRSPVVEKGKMRGKGLVGTG